MSKLFNLTLAVLVLVPMLAASITLAIYDFRSKTEHSLRQRMHMRIIICASILILSLKDLFLWSGTLSPYLCFDAATALMAFLFIPSHYEDIKSSRAALALLLSANIILSVVFRFTCPEIVMQVLAIVQMMVSSGYLVWRCHRRLSSLNTIFRPSAPMDFVTDNFRYLAFLAAFLLQFLAVYSLEIPIISLTSLLCLGLLAFLYVRSVKDRTYFLGAGKEQKIDALVKGVIASPYSESQQSDDRIKDLYAKIVTYMQTKKPYLDDDFKIKDLSMYVFCNKSLVSRAVNDIGHCSFPMFVNKFRIDEAKEMLLKDPKLKMVQVAMMVGFHSVTTFNVAFKVFTGSTPTVWLQHIHFSENQ